MPGSQSTGSLHTQPVVRRSHNTYQWRAVLTVNLLPLRCMVLTARYSDLARLELMVHYEAQALCLRMGMMCLTLVKCTRCCKTLWHEVVVFGMIRLCQRLETLDTS